MLALKRNFENNSLLEKAEIENRQVTAIIPNVSIYNKGKKVNQTYPVDFIHAENFLHLFFVFRRNTFINLNIK